MAGRLRFALAALASCLPLGACVLDLDHLSGGAGGAASTITTTTSAGGSGSGGTGGGDGGACALLDCSCITDPVTIAAGAPLADSPRGVAVTADGLYWTDEIGGEIVFAPASGGAPQVIAPANAPRALDAFGSTLVWGAQDGLFTCTAPSCAASKIHVLDSAGPGSLGEVAYDGQVVVWGDLGSGPNSGKVQACTLATCGPIVLQANMIMPGGVRVAGDAVFWTEEGNGNLQGTVSTAPKSSTSLTQIAAGLDLPAGVASDGTYVYWTRSSGTGQVLSCAIAGAPCSGPVDIAPAAGALGHPRDLRVAGGRVYWTTTDDGAIRSCPQPGCGSAAPKVHVTGRLGIQKIAVGASCLFWTEDGGAVMKTKR